MHKNLWMNRFRVMRYYRRQLYKHIVERYKKTFVEFDGRKMYLDDKDSLKISIKKFEPAFVEFLKKNIKKGDIVVDLGANIGFYTCLFAQLVGPTGRVYAFEPAPSNCELIRRNVEVNGYRNVVVEQKAVSNKSGRVRLYFSISSLDNRIFDFGDEERNSIEVECITLDDYFKSQKIDIIKSNIQGADCAAMEGAADLIKRSKPRFISVEYDPPNLANFGSDPEMFLDMMLDFGYKMYDIIPYGKEIQFVTKSQVMKRYTRENLKGTGLLFMS